MNISKLTNREVFDYVRNPDTDCQTLRLFLNHKEHGYREEIALHPNSNSDLLEEMSKDDNAEVRAQIPFNDNVTPELLDFLSKDKNKWVRVNVSCQKNVFAQTLDYLSKDKNKEVKHGVANNTNSSDQALKVLMKDKDEWVVIAAKSQWKKRGYEEVKTSLFD